MPKAIAEVFIRIVLLRVDDAERTSAQEEIAGREVAQVVLTAIVPSAKFVAGHVVEQPVAVGSKVNLDVAPPFPCPCPSYRRRAGEIGKREETASVVRGSIEVCEEHREELQGDAMAFHGKAGHHVLSLAVAPT